MDVLIDKIIELTSNTGKTAVATVVTTLSGFIVDTLGISVNSGEMIYHVENIFKYGAWGVSIVLGVLGMISWCQKQKDRYKEKCHEKNSKKIKK